MGESKLINMNAKNMQEEAKAKVKSSELTYEELKDVASQLNQQNMQLREKLHEVALNDMFMRLNYLFKVVDSANAFPKEFVDKCANEIQIIMTIPEDSENTDTKEE